MLSHFCYYAIMIVLCIFTIINDCGTQFVKCSRSIFRIISSNDYLIRCHGCYQLVEFKIPKIFPLKIGPTVLFFSASPRKIISSKLTLAFFFMDFAVQTFHIIDNSNV